AGGARGDARGGEQRDRGANHDVGPLCPEPRRERLRVEGRGRAYAVGAETAERDGEAVDDAARRAARKGDGHAVAATGEEAHAVDEVVDGRFAILRREMQTFRRPAGARTRQRDDASDIGL